MKLNQSPRETIEALVTLVGLLKPSHFWCDGDNWYSCPKAPDGCADDSKGDSCNCGADEELERIRLTFVELGLDPKEIL